MTTHPPDTSESNLRILLANDAVNVFDTPMPFILEKTVQDELSVRGQLELVFLQVLHKNLHLWSENLHGVGEGGSNFKTSLYRTITMSIKMKTTLA